MPPTSRRLASQTFFACAFRGLFLDALRKGTRELQQVEALSGSDKVDKYQQVDYQMRCV